MRSSDTKPGRLAERTARLKLMLDFALRRGNSMRERARLFYYAEVKPSLAARRWARYRPGRILSFSTRASPHGPFRVHIRDNGLDMCTFTEFFSSRYVLIPPELPPLEPEVVYDIGANIGIASLYYATRFPKAAFYGFEPVPSNVDVCRLNFRNLPRGEVFPWAVGGRSGTAFFEFSEEDLRGGRLEGQGQAKEDASKKRIEVPVFSIADLAVRKELPPPDFVKIDVEGAELEVLKGMGGQAGSIKRLLVETHGPEVDAACRQWFGAHQFAIRHSHEAAPGFAAIWCDSVKG
jgi:FkbM family methyltransferase